jgi:hypothetical protein
VLVLLLHSQNAFPSPISIQAQVFPSSSCLIGSATSVLVLIVWPQDSARFEDEKVVVSKSCASYGTSSLTTTMTTCLIGEGTKAHYSGQG